MYQQLQTDCIVSFRESESYFAYLCGPPPDVVELIRRDESPNSNTEERTRDLMIAGENPTGKQSKMLGNVLSLTQFKFVLTNNINLGKKHTAHSSSFKRKT